MTDKPGVSVSNGKRSPSACLEQTFSENPGHNVFEVKGNKDESDQSFCQVASVN